MLNIKEEFIAKKVMGNHKIWKADTEESLKKKLYRYMKNEVLNDKTKTILYNEITILPYDKMKEAYIKIFNRCGIDAKCVAADSGAIGGSNSAEFMVKSEVGEDDVVFCSACEYAANIEKAEATAERAEVEELLEMEKVAMAKAFPSFTLDKLDDGRLYWIGELTPGIYETKFKERLTYTVMAVYNNNHPQQVMGSSVRIYPVLPDVDDLINKCGFKPFHLLRDSNDNLYLCTNEANNVATGSTVTSAASVLGWAVKWLMSYELVLTGDLSVETFNRHGGI